MSQQNALRRAISTVKRMLFGNNTKVHPVEYYAEHGKEEEIPGFLKWYYKVKMKVWDPYLDKRALFIFHRKNFVRTACSSLIQWTWFDRFILLIIFLNMVSLALYNPTKDNDAIENQISAICEVVFTGLFAVEAVIKIVAMGFIINKDAYMRLGWNVLDFIVLLFSIFTLLPFTNTNVSALRSIRLLRPLSTLRIIPELRIMVKSLLDSVPALINVLLLCLAAFFFFGILGLQLFQGELRYRCKTGDVVDEDTFCDESDNFSIMTGHRCSAGSSCVQDANPNFGYTSFDNILWAFLTIFQCTTLEGWSDVMYWALDTTGWYSAVYFFLLMWVGSFFIVQLFTAVITSKFSETVEDNKQEKERLQAIGQKRKRSFKTVVYYILGIPMPEKTNEDKSDGTAEGEQGPEKYEVSEGPDEVAQEQSVLSVAPSEASNTSGATGKDDNGKKAMVVVDGVVQGSDEPELNASPLPMDRSISAMSQQSTGSVLSESKAAKDEDAKSDNKSDTTSVINGASIEALSTGTGSQGEDPAAPIEATGTEGAQERDEDEESHPEVQEEIKKKKRNVLRRIVESDVFMYGVMCLIILNTVVLAMGYHGMSTTYEQVLFWANVSFTVLFFFEMIIKIIALGLDYFRDKSNIFDMFIVIFSIVELCIPDSVIDNSGVSVLRAFRILRIFRLAKRWKSLNNLITTMRITLPAVSYFSIILGIFIFIFALVGYNLFGGKFDFEGEEAPRTNFDTLFWSMMAIFQVLTGENWNAVMYDAMRATSNWASIYFIVLFSVGGYILLSLFLAILLENFGEVSEIEYQSREEAHASMKASALANLGIIQAASKFKLMRARAQRVVSNAVLRRGNSENSVFEARPRAPSAFVVGVRDEVEEDIENEVESDAERPRSMSKEYLEERRRKSLAALQRLGQSETDLDVADGTTESIRKKYVETGRDLRKSIADLEAWTGAEAARDEMEKAIREQYSAYKTYKSLMREIAATEIQSAFRGFKKRRQSEQEMRERAETDGSVRFHPDVSIRSISPREGAVTKPASTANRMSMMTMMDLDLRREDNATEEAIKKKLEQELDPQLEELDREAKEKPSHTGAIISMRVNLFTVAGLVVFFKSLFSPPRELKEHNAPMSGRAFWIFSTRDPLRRFLSTIINARLFEVITFFFILVSSVTLALENRSDSNSWDDPKYQIIYPLDVIITAFFVMEALLKIYVQGLVLHKTAYFRDGWNVMDFIVVVVSIASLIISDTRIKALRSLRALRAFRPLRLVSRMGSLKVVTNALIATLPSVLNVSLVCGLLFFIFAILGVQLFAGEFYSCNDTSVDDRSACVGTFTLDGVSTNREWTDQERYGFDNIFESLQTLFEVASLEGYLDVMWAAVDARGVDKQPKRNSQPIMVLYFVIFIVVGNFFAINLFVGVLVDKFTLMRKFSDETVFMTPSQREWVQAQRLALRIRAIPKPNFTTRKRPIREFLYNVATGTAFEVFILTLIILNVILMATLHYEQDDAWTQAQTWGNLTFTVIFFFEMVFKLIAIPPRQYISDNWNRFDMFVVTLSLVAIVFDFVEVGIFFPVSVFRILRVVRIFRLFRIHSGLRQLLSTLIMSLPSLFNVGILLLLIFHVYAILGMQLFGQVKHQDFINRQANFETWPVAMMTLFRMSTGEDWNQLMWDCMIQEPDCTDSGDDADCGSEWMAPIYFCSFVLVCSYVLLNLFVAVILDNFNFCKDDDGDKHASESNMENYRQVWARVVPDGTRFMHISKLDVFLYNLGPPLGLPADSNKSDLMKIAQAIRVPLHGKYLNFSELFYALMRINLYCDVESPIVMRLEHDLARKFPSRRIPDSIKLMDLDNANGDEGDLDTTSNVIAMTYAALYIQAVYKGWRSRKMVRLIREERNRVKKLKADQKIDEYIHRLQDPANASIYGDSGDPAEGVIKPFGLNLPADQAETEPTDVSTATGVESIPKFAPFPVKMPSLSRMSSGLMADEFTQRVIMPGESLVGFETVQAHLSRVKMTSTPASLTSTGLLGHMGTSLTAEIPPAPSATDGSGVSASQPAVDSTLDISAISTSSSRDNETAKALVAPPPALTDLQASPEYVVGESVEVQLKGLWKACEVVSIGENTVAVAKIAGEEQPLSQMVLGQNSNRIRRPGTPGVGSEPSAVFSPRTVAGDVESEDALAVPPRSPSPSKRVSFSMNEGASHPTPTANPSPGAAPRPSSDNSVVARVDYGPPREEPSPMRSARSLAESDGEAEFLRHNAGADVRPVSPASTLPGTPGASSALAPRFMISQAEASEVASHSPDVIRGMSPSPEDGGNDDHSQDQDGSERSPSPYEFDVRQAVSKGRGGTGGRGGW